MMYPPKKSIANIFLSTLGLVFIVLFAEILLRTLGPQPLYSFERGLFMVSKEYGYCLTPLVEKTHNQPEFSYIIKSNSYGFRGKEPNFKAARRILILGDSFGMGNGVGEGKNLCDIAQSYFYAQNTDTDIFNTSIAGYFGLNQLKVLKKWIEDYKPNLVILLFNWFDLLQEKSLTVQNGYLVLSVKGSMGPLREWLNNHSHLYCLIKQFYYIKKMKKNIKRQGVGSLNSSDVKDAVAYIAEMKQICDAHEVAFITILLPFDLLYGESAEHKLSRDIVTDHLRDKSIIFKDWATFLPNKDVKTLTYKFDRHWTEKGHLFFSKYLIEVIMSTIGNNQ